MLKASNNVKRHHVIHVCFTCLLLYLLAYIYSEIIVSITPVVPHKLYLIIIVPINARKTTLFPPPPSPTFIYTKGFNQHLLGFCNIAFNLRGANLPFHSYLYRLYTQRVVVIVLFCIIGEYSNMSRRKHCVHPYIYCFQIVRCQRTAG